MVSFIPDNRPNLVSKNVLLSSGITDPIVSNEQTESLFNIFQKSKANITLKWQRSGHNIIELNIIDFN